MSDSAEGNRTTQDKDYLARLNKGFGALGVWMATHRAIVLVVTLATIAAASYFATTVRIDNSLEAFFDSTDQSYLAYTDYQQDFGPDEVGVLVYHAPDTEHGPFDIDVMRKVMHLTEAIEAEVPFIKEVTSLTNVEFIKATGDFLEILEIGLDFPETQETLLARREAMRKKPTYVGGLFNKDVTHAAIIMEMSRTSTDELDRIRADPDGGDGLDNLYPQASQNKLYEILARPEFEGIEFYFSGDVPFNTTYNTVIGSESVLLTIYSLILVLVLAMLFFRIRLAGFLGPFAVVVLGLIFTLGFMGLGGFQMGMLFLMVPTLIIAIGVAQTVHIITEFTHYQAQGMERVEAIRLTLEHVGVPCFLAALTTSIGFLGMTVSKLEAISEVAIYMAVGVFLTFILSISVMICFLSFYKPPPKQAESAPASPGLIARFLDWVIDVNLNRRPAIIAVSLIVFAVSFMGAAKLHVGFNFLDDMKDHLPFKQDTLAIEEVMGGLLNVVYIFDTGKEGSVKNAEMLRQIEALQARADSHDLVKKTYSLVDIIKDLNQSFHGDDPAFNKIPDDNDLIAQYLLLYEISGGEELEDYVSFDQTRTVLELRVESDESDKLRAILEDLNKQIATMPPGTFDVRQTGVGLLWIKMADYIGDSQLPGYGLAFLMIALVLSLAYRSIKVGLLSMIPNLTPVLLALGVMGWAGIHLDYMRLLLGTIAIGIAVDDTVHMLTRCRHEFQKTGNYATAIRNSLTTVGQALIYTTVILVLTFMVFLSSDMAVMASFCILLGITISVALIADLFLLPAILMTFKPFGAEQRAPATAPEVAAAPAQ